MLRITTECACADVDGPLGRAQRRFAGDANVYMSLRPTTGVGDAKTVSLERAMSLAVDGLSFNLVPIIIKIILFKQTILLLLYFSGVVLYNSAITTHTSQQYLALSLDFLLKSFIWL
jgi:hypothetical protein